MLTKCSLLDKHHLCLPKIRFPIWQMAEQMADAIYVMIPEDVNLRDLFLRWVHSSSDVLTSIEENFQISGNRTLFYALKRAFSHWDHMQNMEGAPGVQSGVFALTCDVQLEEEIARLVARVNYCIDQFESRDQVVPQAFSSTENKLPSDQ